MIFDFAAWWKNILKEWNFSDELDAIKVKDDAKQFLEQSSKEQKDSMLDSLMDVIKGEEEGEDLALSLLDGNARHSDLFEIEDIARKRMSFNSNKQESFLLSFLWILARAPKKYHNLVNEYLYNTPGVHISTNIHWAFWPDHPLEFAKAYAHYMSQDSPEWKGNQYMLSFFNNPEAIRYLREYAEGNFWWGSFKEELLRQCENEFWHPDTRDLIREILSD